MMEKFCLGTVQFGLPYGVNNSVGLPKEEEVFQMLEAAAGLGIRVLDTAAAYGVAEARIGNFLSSKGSSQPVSDLKVITKLQDIPENEISKERLEKAFECSLENLKVSSVYGVLLHRAEMYENHIVKQFLSELRSDKRVEKIGISAYHPNQVESLLNEDLIQMIQMPLNPFDRRFYDTGIIEKCKSKGIEVYARSPFLQGLLLMTPEAADEKVKGSGQWVKKLNQLVKDSGADLYGFLLRYGIEVLGADYVVFGIDHVDQLDQMKRAMELQVDFSSLFKAIEEQITITDERIYLPYLW